MSKIIEYEYGAFDSAFALSEWVNESIKEGWQPFGSPCITLSSGQTLGEDIVYGQAMVRYE